MAGHPTKVWFSYMDEAVFLSLSKVCLFSGTPVFQPQQAVHVFGFDQTVFTKKVKRQIIYWLFFYFRKYWKIMHL